MEEVNLFWVNDLSYRDRSVNLLEAKMETEDEKSRPFLFITNIRITTEKLVLAGRSRWKIENEGFNHQKNGWHHLEHVNCHHYTAMKNHYLLVQIADILIQLYLNGGENPKEV